MKFTNLKHKTKIVGKKTYYFKSIASTQDFAKEIAGKEKEGVSVIADRQTAGRGRLNRKWLSPEGGVYLSIVLKPDLQIKEFLKLTLISAVSVSRTIAKQANIKTSLKWPNDILINERKVAGILTEGSITNNRLNFMVVGIGINLNNKMRKTGGLLYPATSIKEEANRAVEKEKFIENLLFDFDEIYLYFRKNGFSGIFQEWKSKSSTLGRYVTVLSDAKKITGFAQDITEDGYLILKSEGDDITRIVTGDVVQ